MEELIAELIALSHSLLYKGMYKENDKINKLIYSFKLYKENNKKHPVLLWHRLAVTRWRDITNAK